MMAFFALNLVIYAAVYCLNKNIIPDKYTRLAVIVFVCIAHFNQLSTLYVIYALIQKPISIQVKLLWIEPFAILVYELVLLSIYPSAYNLPPHPDLYFDLAFYFRIPFLIILIWEIKNLDVSYQSVKVKRNGLNVISFLWGKWFLFFQLIKLLIGSFYIFTARVNDQFFAGKLINFTYSEETYNTIMTMLLAYFLFVFGYLAIKNNKIFKNEKQQ